MRLIHTADIHLGASPDPGSPWSGRRQEEIWNSWRRLIDQVRQERADLLVIAGDLFHRQPLVRELKEVNYLFSTIPDTTVVLMAGNHDYIGRGSYYPDFPWNPNVIGLWDSRCQRVEIPRKNTCVYGCSYHQREVRDNLYAGVRPQGREAYHILVAHGGDDRHSPLDRRELAAAGFDYVALGHIHKPQVLVENRVAFSGALEPIDRNDTGIHGYRRVTLSAEGGREEFVPFACRSYLDLDVQVEESTTQFQLEEEIRARMEEEGRENIFRLRLAGQRDAEMEFSQDRLRQLGNISEVEDRSQPAYDLKQLAETYEGSLIGAYIRHFADSKDPVEQKALFYGIRALLDAKRDL